LPRWSSALWRPPKPRNASPGALVNESAIVTAFGLPADAVTRIVPAGPGATVTTSRHPAGSLVVTTIVTPARSGAAVSTSRAE
jgi:hypothetical protein